MHRLRNPWNLIYDWLMAATMSRTVHIASIKTKYLYHQWLFLKPFTSSKLNAASVYQKSVTF